MSLLAQRGTRQINAVSKSQRKSSAAPQPIIEKRPFVPDPPMLPSDTEEAELTEIELDDQESVLPSSTTASELGDDDEAYSDKHEDDDGAYSDEHEDDDGAYSDDHEDDDWEASKKTPKAKQLRSTVPVSPSADYAQLKGRLQAVPKSSNNQRVAKLTKYMDNLDISEKDGADSTIKKIYESLNVDDDDEEEINLPVVKKKKRSVIL